MPAIPASHTIWPPCLCKQCRHLQAPGWMSSIWSNKCRLLNFLMKKARDGAEIFDIVSLQSNNLRCNQKKSLKDVIEDLQASFWNIRAIRNPEWIWFWSKVSLQASCCLFYENNQKYCIQLSKQAPKAGYVKEKSGGPSTHRCRRISHLTFSQGVSRRIRPAAPHQPQTLVCDLADFFWRIRLSGDEQLRAVPRVV